MANFDIAQTTVSDLTNTVKPIAVDAKNTDGVSSGIETTYDNANWAKYFGYFNAVPDLKSALLMKAIWNVGKGYKTDTRTQVILDNIIGWGKDTFEDILFNMEVVRRIGGDAFAEIIRSPETGQIINLKPLDPGSITIVVNSQGIIKRYEQKSKLGNNKAVKKFRIEQILHLTNNRLADQIHGISDIESLESTILAEMETFDDIQKVAHRQAKPMIMFKLGTDNQTKINAFIAKMDKATNKGENIYIPNDKDAVDFEVIQVNMSQILLEWRNDIRNRFYRTIGLPQIIPGAGGQGTESESKVIYFAFEQLVEKDQRALERQIEEQIGLKINLIPPATLAQDLQKDEAKDAGQQTIISQPNDTQAGVGR